MFGWLEFSGVVAVGEEKDYSITEEEILQKKRKLALEKDLVGLVKENLKKHLSKFIWSYLPYNDFWVQKVMVGNWRLNSFQNLID